MTLFTTMTLICLYYTYFGQQLEKGKLAIIHKLNMYTVVKWGHTEGIPREKTSSEKYTVFPL